MTPDFWTNARAYWAVIVYAYRASEYVHLAVIVSAALIVLMLLVSIFGKLSR